MEGAADATLDLYHFTATVIKVLQISSLKHSTIQTFSLGVVSKNKLPGDGHLGC